jgi:hypothetical protein
VASRVSVISCSLWPTAAALLRMLPPFCPSVVEEASSSCSVRDAAHQGLDPRIATAMANQARDLGLVHGKDHSGRRAGAAECVTDLGHVMDRGAMAAEDQRNLHAQQFFATRRVDGGFRKTDSPIDVVGVSGRRRGDHGRALQEQRAAIDQQRLGGCK